MNIIVKGYLDFFQVLVYLAWFILVSPIWIAFFLMVFVCLVVVFIVVRMMGWLGVTRTFHGKRKLIKILRVLPFAKDWRSFTKKKNPVTEQPFAIDLYEVDPLCFIGMRRTDISTVLRAGIDIEFAERDTAEVRWTRKYAEVECWFINDACRDCSFFTKDEKGARTKISSTRY